MKLAKLWSAFFLFFLFFFFPKTPVFAAVIITNSLSSVALEEEFTLNFTGSELENGVQYYAKARIGQSGSSSNPYNKGETKKNDSWFGDSSSFESFPIFTADSNGNTNGSLVARAKSTASLGENSLFVRLRKAGTETNYTSESVLITLTELASSTPTPTTAPTNTPTPTTAPTPTKTPTPTPIKTPTPTPIKSGSTSGAGATATPKPTLPPTSAPTKTLALSSQAAGGSVNINTVVSPIANLSLTSTKSEPTKKPKPTPLRKASRGTVAILGVAQTNLSKILIGVGVIFLLACGILAFRSFRKGKDDSHY